MQRIENHLETIKASIKNEIKDHSLVSQLNKELQHTQINPELVSGFTKAVFSLYDLSNHHSLVQRIAVKNGPVRFEHDEMALEIKLTVFKMLSSLVVFYTENTNIDLPSLLLCESLQIMILIARLFIDAGQSTEIKPLYSLVNTLHQVATEINPEIEMLHHLNSIELMRMDVDRTALDVYQFKRCLDAFYETAKKIHNPVNYIQLVQYITLEVVLKLIKAGFSDKCKLLKQTLPQKLMDILSSVTNFQSRLLETDLPQLKISPFYQLFLSLKAGGSQQISEERLRAFISSNQNFKDPRIFDVVALTGCLLPLEIWLQTYINTKQKCQNISNAYKCFIYIADKFFCSNPNSSPELALRYQQKLNQLASYIKISQLVMLALLLEKKQTQEPLLFILKRILKVMIHCVINLYPKVKEVKDFGDKLLLICGKFGVGDLSKSVNCIMFYYQILMGTANEQSFNKFYKSNLMDKNSQIFKTVKLAYEIRSNKANLASQDIESIKKQPYLAVLFQKQLKDNIILTILPQQFCRLPEKFQIYFMLASILQNSDVEEDVAKLAEHMEETFIRIEHSQITKLDIRYISMITAVLMKFMDSSKEKLKTEILCKINVVVLYLVSFEYFGTQMSTLNTGILLNRYSKLTKLLSFSFECLRTMPENQRGECIQRYLYLSKSMLCWSLQQLKLVYQSRSTPLEPGSLNFFDLLQCFILQNEKAPQNIDFIRFVRFEMSCLTDTVSDTEITQEKNLKLLKIFSTSRWIKKNVKLKILRKLIKEQLISESRQITLQDLNDLIILSQNPIERKMYAEYLLKLFGEQGKTYLLMQSAMNPRGYQFLSDQNDDDDNLI